MGNRTSSLSVQKRPSGPAIFREFSAWWKKRTFSIVFDDIKDPFIFTGKV